MDHATMTDPTARKAKHPGDEADTARPEPHDPLTAASVDPAPAQDPLAETRREAADLKDKLLRTLAEMENLRKRTEREIGDARAYGIAGFARDVLAVADNMHRA